ncbi:MAG: rhodanese-like domain-containing protein [Nanoarchaeota archaeon]
MDKIKEEISAKDAYDLINSEDIILIDVRTKNEHNLEKIKNSINIDLFSKDFQKDILKLDKNHKYIVYCRSGQRSRSAMEIMNKLNFNEVYNLDGGIILWKNNNLPVE